MTKIFSNLKLRGALLATLSALCLSIIMALAKQLDPEVPTSLVVFVRSCFGMLFFIPFLFKNKEKIIHTKKPWLHVLRACFVVTTMLCTYYTYRNLPVAFATSLGMTGALFTTILSLLILKDKIGFWRWVVVFTGYAGVILVIRPTSFILDFAIITALLGNMFASCAIIIAKILSKEDSTITIMLYSNVGITIISAILNSSIHGWTILTPKDFCILALTGVFGISAQFCSVTALKFTSPSFLAPFEYTRIIFAVLIGIFIFQEFPDLSTMVGALIIICSTCFLTKI